MGRDQAAPPIDEPWWSRYKWLLASGLALAIALIVIGIVLANQPGHKRAAQPTSTPTPTATPKPKPKPTSTPILTPTAVPTHAAPTPTPTATPSLTPIPTVVGLSLGYVHRSHARIEQLQAMSSAGQPGYAFYLHSVKTLAETLGSYGFTGRWTVIQPSQPSPTPTVSPTAYRTPNGIPAEKFIVRYQGHTYEVVLEQLARHGAGGIWLIWQVGPRLT